MPQKLQTARNLSQKLTKFRASLTKSEQVALDDLLQSFVIRTASSSDAQGAPKPAASGLIALPEGAQAIGELRTQITKASKGPAVFATPTWTLTTTTTVAASHPIITCGPSDDTEILATLTVKVGCEVIAK
jgi:hypothetical protein